MFFRMKKPKKYGVDIKTADQILQNVFAEAKVEPNNISFENIIKRSRLNVISDNIYILVTAILFVAVLLCPLFMPKGSVFMSVDHRSQRELAIVSHSVVDGNFTIRLEGPMVDSAATYVVDPEGNELSVISYDSATNTLVLPFGSGDYNIYIYDVNGRLLHLLLSASGSGHLHR